MIHCSEAGGAADKRRNKRGGAGGEGGGSDERPQAGVGHERGVQQAAEEPRVHNGGQQTSAQGGQPCYNRGRNYLRRKIESNFMIRIL